ncbi:hypothetical protein KCP74_01930 [Salmonella enterica subsp. enterica]|nr:hypothetical protein KCP74_01930 [Salmonella enterica subsp. enterica]
MPDEETCTAGRHCSVACSMSRVLYRTRNIVVHRHGDETSASTDFAAGLAA